MTEFVPARIALGAAVINGVAYRPVTVKDVGRADLPQPVKRQLLSSAAGNPPQPLTPAKD